MGYPIDLRGVLRSVYQKATFEIKLERTENLWTVSVNAPGTQERYLHEFKVIGPGRLQSSTMDRFGHSHLVGVATDVLFFMAELGFSVESSTRNRHAGEFRSPDAEKLWKRLLADGYASYDASEDVYRLHPSGTQTSSGALGSSLDGLDPRDDRIF